MPYRLNNKALFLIALSFGLAYISWMVVGEAAKKIGLSEAER